MALDLNQQKVYGSAQLDITSGLATMTTAVRLDVANATTYPNSHVGSDNLSIRVDHGITNGPWTGPIVFFYLAVVVDASDIVGNVFNSEVIDFVEIGNSALLPTQSTVSVTLDGRPGTIRYVILAGDSAANAQDRANVDTGPSSTMFHYDSDAAGNTAKGGAAVNSDRGTGILGSLHRTADLATVNIAGDNFKYGDQITIDGKLNATPLNAKSLGIGIGPNGDTTSPTKFLDVQVNATTGDVAALSNIDTDYSSSPSDYFALLGANNTFGRSTTPAAQLPDLYSSGSTITGLSTSQRAWTTFGSPSNFINNGGGTTVGHGIFINSVESYNESGRTNVSNGFTRSDSSLAPHDTPFLRAVIHDAYGNPLASTDITMRVLDSDGTQENSQNLTTDVSGVIDWSYTISNSHKAFNRFKKTSPDDPDALNTHQANYSSHKPAGSKTNQYPDPVVNTITRSFAGAQPARSKDVRVLGREYGTKEPQDTVVDVFGVSSEIIFEGMWSGNTTDRSDNNDGVPQGPIGRSKVTAAGSFAMKTCSLVDEAAFGVADDTAHNPTDVWGRPFQNHTLYGSRALYDSTNANVEDAGSDLDGTENLDGPLGYSIHGNDTQTYDLIPAPSDATTYAYYQGFAGTTGQRGTFSFTAPGSRGFTSDTGIYGYKRQVVEYSIVRDDLAIVAAMSSGQPAVNAETRGTATAVQILPDNTLLPSTFDGAPRYVIHQVVGAGIPLSLVEDGECTQISGSEDYEFSFTPTSPGTYGVTIFGKVAGSRPSPGRALFVAGFDTDIKLLVIPSVIQSDPTLVRRYTVKVARGSGATLSDVNPDSAPRFYVLGTPASGAAELLSTGLATAIGAEPTSDWEFNVTVPLGYDSVKVYVTALVSGAPVIGGDVQAIQVGYQFDAVAFAAGIPFK